jgi:hypothetical protein
MMYKALTHLHHSKRLAVKVAPAAERQPHSRPLLMQQLPGLIVPGQGSVVGQRQLQRCHRQRQGERQTPITVRNGTRATAQRRDRRRPGGMTLHMLVPGGTWMSSR